MPDSRFFSKLETLSLAQLADLTGATLSKGANQALLLEDVAPLGVACAEHVSFLDNPKYVEAFSKSKAGACFVHPKYADHAPAGMALLLSQTPYLAYALAAMRFYPPLTSTGIVSKRANIEASAFIGARTQVQAGAFIGEHVKIGENCMISANAVIHAGVEIGDETHIGANTTISHALIGSRVIIHPNVSIGQDGFGFAASDKGAVKVPQLGRVIIEDDVEIGAGTCIDRGAGPDTVIMMGAKIDNLVQIGHNVRIGRYATLVAQVGISGSTEIGDGATIAGQVGIAGHLKIGKKVVIAAKSGVTNHVPDGASYGGFPAIPIMQWRRQVAALTRLIKKKDALS